MVAPLCEPSAARSWWYKTKAEAWRPQAAGFRRQASLRGSACKDIFLIVILRDTIEGCPW